MLHLDCPSLPDPPEHSMLLDTNIEADGAGTFSPGTIATYQCLPGFEATGTATIACLSDGWEQLDLTCIRGAAISCFS